VLEAVDLSGPLVEGASLLPLMRGGADDGRIAYADALNLYDAHAPTKMRAEYLDNLYCIRQGSWKLIWHEQEPVNVELFDLEADPLELKNIAAAHPDVVERLKGVLDERRAMEVHRPGPGGAAPDTDLLRGLGYTDGHEEEDEDKSGD
jgi:arylsulfatase A-like enzyme